MRAIGSILAFYALTVLITVFVAWDIFPGDSAGFFVGIRRYLMPAYAGLVVLSGLIAYFAWHTARKIKGRIERLTGAGLPDEKKSGLVKLIVSAMFAFYILTFWIAPHIVFAALKAANQIFGMGLLSVNILEEYAVFLKDRMPADSMFYIDFSSTTLVKYLLPVYAGLIVLAGFVAFFAWYVKFKTDGYAEDIEKLRSQSERSEPETI
ncbi:MAG: hypothetical protein LBB57_07015 [Clostridiales Family XIII bacterium]|jgi:hypothetical protein|nr:hypothetical protein [Clostridiales Family XIII bacterium]